MQFVILKYLSLSSYAHNVIKIPTKLKSHKHMNKYIKWATCYLTFHNNEQLEIHQKVKNPKIIQRPKFFGI